ncbi:MAG: ABC-F family ATP-binding cassette domain-containing protein [Anaerolineales bacterium]|nr:ABC-F family ATP-binding cassette domain-containing protein [Anaerolineales bacterium]
MIAVSFANVSLVLGARPIFRDLYWEIQRDQRVGLIGPNGAGKSSLLKLITGEYTPEPGGQVVKTRGLNVGYLAQEPDLDLRQTALEAALAGNARVAELEAELDQVEQRLGDRAVYGDERALTRTLERQERLLDEYKALGGAGYAERVAAALRGLGLSEADSARPIGALSGGQKKLVGLARLLLARPDVLLLDEPDNHLDLAGKAFLEQLINTYSGAVVIISHDRYLLDAVVTHIAEIEDGRLTTFAGVYSTYVAEKEERLARLDELYRVQQRKISRIEAAIKRYAVWAKVYDNEKFAKRAQSIQKQLDKVDRIERPVLERRRMELALRGWRGSSKVLEMTGVEKRFGAEAPLRGVDLLLRHGDRVGLIGANGAGKSVLLRIIRGATAPDAGQVKLGPSVQLGYYAQEHETLAPEQTPLQAARRAAAISEDGAVAFLKRYLFSYQQVAQRIGALSGGERSRLQMALLVLSGANFLLLDEPTNNLDIASAEVLEDSLADFEGTVLVISHDRYFLDRTVNRIVELEAGRLTEYVGTFADYTEKKAQAGPSRAP